MELNDSEKFLEIMMGLAENFSVEVSPIGVKLRFEALKQFSIEEIERAAIRIMQDRKYTTLPTVADFVDNLGGKTEDIAAIEAGNVIEALRRYGSYTSVVFDDPITQAVIVRGFGGWVKMGTESMEGEEKWIRRDFEKLYSSFKRQGVEQFGPLPGVHEIENVAKGHGDKLQAPVLIGNPERAQFVLENASKNVDLLGDGQLGTLIKQIGNDSGP